jgi:hypothetical protein
MNKSYNDSVIVENGLFKDPFFLLYESHLVLNFKEEKKIFNLDEISNLRYLKKRDYKINFLFFILGCLGYYISLFSIKTNLLLLLLSLLIASTFIIISLSIENHNKLLLINVGNVGFKKLKISNKDDFSAEKLVRIFRINYLEKRIK